MTRQKKNLKTVSVHYKNTDLILKMIKKAKMFRVKVPLKSSKEKDSLERGYGRKGSLKCPTIKNYRC